LEGRSTHLAFAPKQFQPLSALAQGRFRRAMLWNATIGHEVSARFARGSKIVPEVWLMKRENILRLSLARVPCTIHKQAYR
jgi:hypothetical protein